jgi:serine/threonine protein kinase
MELCNINLEQFIYGDWKRPGVISRRLEGLARFEMGDVCSILHEVTDGVAFIHAHGEIHRDLKPTNSSSPCSHHTH